LTKTDIVRPQDERPARRDGTCFYCSAVIGASHKDGCVVTSKSVVIRATLDVVVSVPRDWNEGMIEFKFCESSWCADNFLGQLGRWVSQEPADGRAGCACECSGFEFVRDATEADHRELPVLIDATEDEI